MKKVSFLLLIGIALGAVAGLLLAPEEGKETRKKLSKKSKELKKTIEDTISEYKDKAKDLKDKMSDLKDNLTGAAKDVKERFS